MNLLKYFLDPKAMKNKKVIYKELFFGYLQSLKKEQLR